jgi:hypothetical protein
MTKLAPHQIAQSVYSVASEAIKTTLVNTEIAIELSAEDGDSVRSWQGDEPIGWDAYSQVLSVGDTVVTRTYKSGGLAGTTVGTVVYTYSTNARTFLVSLVRS